MLRALGIWITGYILGNSADELLTWFAQYENDTKTEGTDKTTGDVDPDGTSIQYDLFYHSITALYSYIVLVAISVGGFIFSANFASWGGPVSNCELKNEAAKFAGWKDTLTTLNQGTYANC